MVRVLPMIFGCLLLVGGAVAHAHYSGLEPAPEMLAAAVDVSVEVMAQ